MFSFVYFSDFYFEPFHIYRKVANIVKELFFWTVLETAKMIPITSEYLSVYFLQIRCAVLCLVAQSCPILCNPIDCSLPGPSVHGDSPGQNTGISCHALLQGMFPTQGLNLKLMQLLHCRKVLYCWATREAPLDF